MTRFVGKHVEEIARLYADERVKLILLCSVMVMMMIACLELLNQHQQSLPLSIINGLSISILAMNSWSCWRRDGQFSDITLSVILLFQVPLLLIFYPPTLVSIFWLYPLVSIVVFVNNFRFGAFFSLVFALLVTASLLMSNNVAFSSTNMPTFILSFTLFLGLLNTIHFYAEKLLHYIEHLSEQGISELAFRDHLTGLANRWSFENAAQRKLSEQLHSNPLTAIVFIDVDNFKNINDNYGHSVGDRMLKEIAVRLTKVNCIRQALRDNDCALARYAGDEFILMLSEINSVERLESMLNELSQLFNQQDENNEMINSLTMSVGVAIHRKDGLTLEELTRCADKAMYQAKQSGKNQYSYYYSSMTEPLQELASSGQQESA